MKKLTRRQEGYRSGNGEGPLKSRAAVSSMILDAMRDAGVKVEALDDAQGVAEEVQKGIWQYYSIDPTYWFEKAADELMSELEAKAMEIVKKKVINFMDEINALEPLLNMNMTESKSRLKEAASFAVDLKAYAVARLVDDEGWGEDESFIAVEDAFTDEDLEKIGDRTSYDIGQAVGLVLDTILGGEGVLSTPEQVKPYILQHIEDNWMDQKMDMAEIGRYVSELLDGKEVPPEESQLPYFIDEIADMAVEKYFTVNEF